MVQDKHKGVHLVEGLQKEDNVQSVAMEMGFGGRRALGRSGNEVNDDKKGGEDADDDGQHEQGEVAAVAAIQAHVPAQEVDEAQQQVDERPVRTERAGEGGEATAVLGAARAHKAGEVRGGRRTDVLHDGAAVHEEEGGQGGDVEAQRERAVARHVDAGDERLGAQIGGELLVDVREAAALQRGAV